MSLGSLALVLHAHLPFVRHPEHEDFLEEDWLYEAISETYLPLLRVFDGLAEDGVPFRVTMSLTPTLVTMLRDELLMERYARKLDRLCELGAREVHRTRNDPDLWPTGALLPRLTSRRLRVAWHERYQRRSGERVPPAPGRGPPGDHHLLRHPRLPAADAGRRPRRCARRSPWPPTTTG